LVRCPEAVWLTLGQFLDSSLLIGRRR